MHRFNIVLGLVGLLSSVLAAPAPVTRAVPEAFLQQIINIEDGLVNLANDFVEANATRAKQDYASTNTRFVAFGKQVLSSGYTCPPNTAEGAITVEEEAIISLNYSQTALKSLVAELRNSSSTSTPETIDEGYCNSYASFLLVQYFTDNYVKASAPTGSGFNKTEFDDGELAAQLALQVLVSSINLGENEAITYTGAQSALAEFQTLARLRAFACPDLAIAPPTTARAAVGRVETVQRLVHTAYADRAAGSSNASEDFCGIQRQFNSILGYVQKH